jgi:glycosyltransferase involved in cell wall biosynthesis
MKILQVAPYFTPYLGGQEKYIHHLSKKLVKNKQEVTVLTSNYPETSPYEFMDGIKVVRKDILMKPLRNPISPGFLRLNKISKEYDVIHLHNEYSFPVMIAAALKNKKTPLILTNHLGQLNFENKLKNKIGNIYLKTVGKWIWRKCDAIIALSDSQKEFLTSIEPEISSKIHVVPNAIDLDSLKQSSLRIGENKFLEDQKNFTLLYVGQLIKRKGLKWLILAINILKNEFPQLKLVLVGDGEDREYFQKMVTQLKLENHIEFKGRIEDTNELVVLYKYSNAFVLPSLSEGLPTVILEALYFGLPIIGTNIPGIQEFNKYTNLVPPRDEEELAKAIKSLLNSNSPVEKHSLAVESRKMVENEYNWEVVAREYQHIYEELLPK